MNTILLERIANNKPAGYCIGRLYINNVYVCDTLEDVDRGLDNTMDLNYIKTHKVYGQTAIPTGTYTVTMNIVSDKFKNHSWASQFKGFVPRLLCVKGYEGVLIHPGNTKDNTLGCILVGINSVKGMVTQSQKTWLKLMKKYFWPLRNQSWQIVIRRKYSV